MPYKEKEIEKMYYGIGDVAEMYGVSTSLLRFWEKEFDILQPKKNRKGDRFFTQKDMENLKVIFHLVKERGFTLKGAKQKLKENRDDLATIEWTTKRPFIDFQTNFRPTLTRLTMTQ